MSEFIGFFSVESTKDNKGYVGAILIIDDKGIPQEFRVTEAIKPTIIQKQLYGKSLNEFIGVTLCGKPLYDIIRVKPGLLVVNQNEHVGLGDEVDCFLMCVKSIDDPLVINDIAEKKTSKILPKNKEFNTLSSAFPRSYDEEKKNECIKLVTKFTNTIDLLEPFERIKVAISTLSAQDNRFS